MGNRTQIEKLHLDFLQFSQRYWFEDLTNQMQGRELLDLWRGHMKLPQIYQQVREAVTGVNQFLDIRQEAEFSSSTFYLVIATLGLALSLAIGFFGMEKLEFEYAPAWTLPKPILERFWSEVYLLSRRTHSIPAGVTTRATISPTSRERRTHSIPAGVTKTLRKRCSVAQRMD
ncbi:MAG: hypothetical protein ACREX4_00055 [Gammaproteobacteria bacterium]